MYADDVSLNSLDALLAGAKILPDYDPGQAPTAAERIARAAARNRPDMVVCHSTHSDADEQARRELDLISAKVLNTPQAAASLDQLGITDHVEPEGAMVFACLLHLIGRDEGAQFWWKFAAGSGIPDAARCLALHYESNADHADAHYWRDKWPLPTVQQGEQKPEPVRAARHPLLPEHVAKQLLEQCERGLKPELPADLTEAVDKLVIEYDDESLGPIPHPRRPDTLGAHH